MPRIAICVCIMLTVLSASAQMLTGVVSDRKTNEPLPYVHIGVVGKNMGVISRDDGSYEIDVTTAHRDDMLAFSIIGFETRTYKIGELGSGKMDVQLTQRTYLLKDVVVVRDTKEKPVVRKLGRSTPTKTTSGQSGMREFGFGGEWGLRINTHGRTYFVHDLHFHMRFNTVDSILFRVNMYRIEDNMPGESILQRELFMIAKKKQKWIVRDLQKENIQLDQDLIVTVEVVRVWFGNRGENRMFFTMGAGYEEGRTYYRASSQAAWTVDQYPGPATLYLTVEEY